MRRRTSSCLRLVLAAAAAAAAAGCFAPPVASPPEGLTTVTPIRVPQNDASPVDVLFMIDNSRSMDAMQAELRARFGSFLQAFDRLAAGGFYADLHIGVVTSDYGAGDRAAGGCDASPGGDRGLLQPLGKAAPPGCRGPAGGARFLSYAYGPQGATGNLPPGQTLQQTFTCMASVGSSGCGFEHPLESVYAALRNERENAGFLRPDAILAVLFVTNEDDGSAPPDARIYEDDPQWGPYTTYRQTRYGIACGSPPMLPPDGPSNGLLDDCVPAPNTPDDPLGELYDVRRYVSLFTAPAAEGGIKRSPDDVVLVALDGPAQPVQTVLVDATSGGPCAAPSPSCVVALAHSCINPAAPAFFADPAVRLEAVVRAARNSAVFSICGEGSGPPDFSAVLEGAAALIARRLPRGCIPAALPDPDHPDCVVEDVTFAVDGGEQVRELARCDRTGGATPCWRVVATPDCAASSPQSLAVKIDRGGVPAPPETVARVACTTLAR